MITREENSRKRKIVKTKFVNSKNLSTKDLRAESYIENPVIEKLEILQFILLDLLSGQHAWYDIQNLTGLGEKRCMEIEEVYHSTYKEVGEKWKKEDEDAGI